MLFLWDHRFVKLLNLIEAPVRAKLAVISVLALLLLVASSLFRVRFRLSYPAWQALHGVLALTVVVTAVTHVLLIGYYVDEPWEKVVWVLYTAVFVWIVLWVRVVKPIQRHRRRLRVVGVREEAGGAHTLELEVVRPEAFGPDAFHFRAGQFAWILLGRSPFAMTYHPFSFSSSAEHPERIAFTVRAFGAFTSGLGEVEVGQTVYLDGPWGHFTPDRYPAEGLVLLAGGVGITPMLSILKTLRDRGDRRPRWLFFAARDEDSLTGRAELDDLGTDPLVTIVYVLSRPASTWAGETGHVDADLLRRHLPDGRDGLRYFICGPDPMMDAAEEAARALGAPPQTVHSERFAMA